MGTPRKRTVAVAAGVSAALLASSTAFAVANGILGSRPNDKVGTFGMIEQRLVPAESPARTTAPHSAPPRVTTTTAARALSIAPAEAARHESPDTNAPGVTPNEPAAEQEPDEHSTPKPTIVAPASTTPTTHTTASTVPKEDDHEHETDDTEQDDD
jgi:hypothetical protein